MFLNKLQSYFLAPIILLSWGTRRNLMWLDTQLLRWGTLNHFRHHWLLDLSWHSRSYSLIRGCAEVLCSACIPPTLRSHRRSTSPLLSRHHPSCKISNCSLNIEGACLTGCDLQHKLAWSHLKLYLHKSEFVSFSFKHFLFHVFKDSWHLLLCLDSRRQTSWTSSSPYASLLVTISVLMMCLSCICQWANEVKFWMRCYFLYAPSGADLRWPSITSILESWNSLLPELSNAVFFFFFNSPTSALSF